MNLLDQQYQLEQEMITSGVDRYRSQQAGLADKGRASETTPGRRLVSGAIPRLSAAVEQFIEQANTGRAGRRHTAVKYLRGIDPEVCAFLTCKAVLDSVETGNSALQGVARRIGQMLQDEVAFKQFEKEVPRLWAKITKDMERAGTSYAHGRQVLRAAAKRFEIGLPAAWAPEDSIRVGTKLVEMFIESTQLVEMTRDMTKPKGRGRHPGTYVLRATQATLDWIATMNDRAELLFPVYMPCVVPPEDWTSPTDGGYLGPMAHKLTLVKTRNEAYLEELGHRDMPVVYSAINALQRTPWQVNRSVFAVMREAVALQLPIGNLPTGQMEDLPPRPADIEVNEEARKAWRLQARDVYAHNLRIGTKSIQLSRMVALADRYEEFEEIYFPYTLDFRGRAYPVTGLLHPQGSDVAKSLLRFGTGKRLGPDGAAWLAIHLSNSYGYDKVTLEDRIKWVEDNEEHILQSAMAPLDYLWWSEGDSPWQVLAACFEWMGWKLQGEDFVSHLPVAMDGSCNGLQHYSAMLRDEVGGEAVNLTPHQTPADIYGKVRDAVVDSLHEIACGDAEEDERVNIALNLLASGQVDRTLCKRPVMTMPYGSKQFGIRAQIYDELCNRKSEKGDLGLDDPQAASTLLAKLVWDAIGTTVIAARVGMDWLQKAATMISAEALPISWTAPNGLPVLQEYRSQRERRVKTQFAGTVVRMVVKEDDPDKLDKHKQRNGIAPNFVHSLDASAMMLTVCEAEDQGLTSFSMVHDSYATHACDASTLALCLRTAFIRMYEDNPVLEEFSETIRSQLSPKHREDLPEVPARGNLDLSKVLESDFFFA